MLYDLKLAFRGLARRSRLAAAVILLLSLGIGAETAIFDIYDALVLRCLPVKDPRSLVVLSVADQDGQPTSMSFGAFEQLSQAPGLFAKLFAYVNPVAVIEIRGQLRSLGVLNVSADYFEALGVKPGLGALIDARYFRDRARPEPVAVLTEAFWRSEFSSDPGIVGKALRIDSTVYTIIGITERNFVGTKVGFPPKVITPLRAPSPESADSLVNPWAEVMGRLASGVSLQQARARSAVAWSQSLNRIAQLGSPAIRDAVVRQTLSVQDGSAGTSYLRTRFSRGARVLVIIGGIVLALACFNSGALLLARAASRRQETMICLALGATRRRLVRIYVAESLILTVPSVALGLFAAYAIVSGLSAYLVVGNTRPELSLVPNGTVFLFSSSIAVLAAIVIAVVPAMAPLRSVTSARRIIGRQSLPAGRSIVVLQTSASIVLTSASFLFYGMVPSLEKTGGVDPDAITIMQLIPAPGGYRNVDLAAYYRDLLDTLSSTPQIGNAALSRSSPVDDQSDFVRIRTSESTSVQAAGCAASPGYFTTMGIPLLSGRDFMAEDLRSSPRVCIPTRDLAQRIFGSDEPIGRQLRTEDREIGTCTIIGIVGSSPLQDLRRKGITTLYVPLFQQRSLGYSVLILRSAIPGASAESQAADVLQSRGREVALYSRTLREAIDRFFAQERLAGLLATCAAAFAVMLCCAGVYGMSDFVAVSRRSEIAVRSALGARSSSVVALVARDGLISVGAGVVIGCPLAWIGNRVIRSMLTVPQSTDVPIVLLVGLMLMAVSAIATLAPLRRALKTDPAAALRVD